MIDVTAHHEAGHAVAACLSRSGQLVSVAIDGTGDTLGHTLTSADVFDEPFISYSGVWAEAYYRREDEGAETARDFEDLLTAVWLGQIGDGGDYDHYQSAHNAVVALFPAEPTAAAADAYRKAIRATERRWRRELEDHWPVIAAVAHRLLTGDVVDHDTIMDVLENHWSAGAAA
jgi:hypothetical protein